MVRGTDLWMTPKLTATMYGDRRKQFRDRLRWPVKVDPDGYERDEYDLENPLYIIVEASDGTHAGSLRLLPTTGKTMLLDHFSDVVVGEKICGPTVWECTRFCLSPTQNSKVALSLLAAAARLMQEAGLQSLVAIFDARMLRLYNRIGIRPKVIGSQSYKFGIAQAGLWFFDVEKYKSLVQASEMNSLELELAVANISVPWRVASFAAKSKKLLTEQIDESRFAPD